MMMSAPVKASPPGRGPCPPLVVGAGWVVVACTLVTGLVGGEASEVPVGAVVAGAVVGGAAPWWAVVAVAGPGDRAIVVVVVPLLEAVRTWVVEVCGAEVVVPAPVPFAGRRATGNELVVVVVVELLACGAGLVVVVVVPVVVVVVPVVVVLDVEEVGPGVGPTSGWTCTAAPLTNSCNCVRSCTLA